MTIDPTGAAPEGAAPPRSLVRHEEEAVVSKQVVETGRVVARKRVDVEHVEEDFPLLHEHAEVERVPAGPDDSGEVETLADGSISIPVLEEELVVTKRTVVRERVVIRRVREVEQRRVGADLRVEHVDVEEVGPEPGA